MEEISKEKKEILDKAEELKNEKNSLLDKIENQIHKINEIHAENKNL